MIYFGILIFIVIVIAVALMIRGFNYNHRIGEGMFKNSEYNLDEPDDFVDKNYYDKDAFHDFIGKDK